MTKWPAVTEGTLTPAYGRDYDNESQARQNFLAGKDFLWNHPTGKYILQYQGLSAWRYSKNQIQQQKGCYLLPGAA